MSFRIKLFLGIVLVALLSSCKEEIEEEVAEDPRPNIVLIMSDDMGYSDESMWPLQRGFDKFYGIIPGATNLFKLFYSKGIATPFIVHWPKGIPQEKRGQIIKEYGFLPDLLVTSVDLAEASYLRFRFGFTAPLKLMVQ